MQRASEHFCKSRNLLLEYRLERSAGGRVHLPGAFSTERVTTMTVRLNHTIVAARDREAGALFLAEMLGLSPPVLLGPFAGVQVGDTALDYMAVDGEIVSQHYAFLVSEAEFDEIFGRIRDRHLPYWADPGRRQRDQINTWDDGRGCYFEDPNGHLLEIITRPYGSGGTVASHPHPLVARELPEPDAPGTDPGRKGGGRLARAEHPRSRGRDT
jgi:hypothetical protein